jgi:hypothetical protein
MDELLGGRLVEPFDGVFERGFEGGAVSSLSCFLDFADDSPERRAGGPVPEAAPVCLAHGFRSISIIGHGSVKSGANGL